MKEPVTEDKAAILIVEDESIVAIDIAQALESLGYSVSGICDTGEKAITTISDTSPDLILMDIQLKGSLDGIAAAEQIRDRFGLPFIYLSTFSDEKTLSRAKRTEPYGYVTKTYDLNNLHSTIEMALYRHRMEKTVREKEELLSITLRSISDAVIGATLDGTIISWNVGAVSIFGFDEDEVKSKNLSILTPSYLPNEMPEILEQVENGEKIEGYETIRRRKDGTPINLFLRVFPIRGANDTVTGVSIICHDISNRKKLEQEVLEIGARERERIGQDLHDSLGQKLTGISLKVKVLENLLASTDLKEEHALTVEISGLVKDAVLQTRELAKGLVPITLRSEGLAGALRELAVLSETLYGIPTECHAEESCGSVSSVIERQLYHIAQEALNNAGRHGQPRKVEIVLTGDSSELVLQVKDDGIGFQDDEKGIGLRIMQYRANMLNAQLKIFSPDEGGTVVSCRVPIHEEKIREPQAPLERRRFNPSRVNRRRQ